MVHVRLNIAHIPVKDRLVGVKERDRKNISCPVFVGVLVVDEESEFTAIKGIHWQLDDNADGAVDFQESEEVGKGEDSEWIVYCPSH